MAKAQSNVYLPRGINEIGCNKILLTDCGTKLGITLEFVETAAKSESVTVATGSYYEFSALRTLGFEKIRLVNKKLVGCRLIFGGSIPWWE